MLRKLLFGLTLSLYFFNINLSATAAPVSNNDAEIVKIQNEISRLQNKLKKLEQAKTVEVATKKTNIEVVTKKPKVGLVLSGGGAKGLAHIGVLRELEANNIRVDYIVGTSIGAIIGAFYSAGYSPDEIEKIVTSTNFHSFFKKNERERVTIPFEKKIINSSNTVTLKYDNQLNFYLPKGLNTSNNVYFLLKNVLSPVAEITDFNKLPIPLRVVATNLDTGEAKAFASGDLARILTASSAIPTIFSPVQIDGVEFVDGMLSKNHPVDEAFKMGANIVIGSDVGVVLSSDKNSYNILSTFSQILAFSSANSSVNERGVATFNIAPNVSSFSPTDFSEVSKIIHEGEIATNKVMPSIKKQLGNHGSTPKINHNNQLHLSSLTDSKVSFQNVVFTDQNIDPNIKRRIYSLIKNEIGKEMTTTEFQSRLSLIQGLAYVDKIFYEFDDDNDTLILDVVTAPSNTFGISGNFRSDYGTTFKLNTDILFLGDIGSLTDLSIKFGDYYGIALNNFSYYGTNNKIGFFSSLSFDQSPLYIYRNNHKEAKYISNETVLNLGITSFLNNKFSMTYGVSYINSSLDLDTGAGKYTNLESKENFGNTFLHFTYDTLDNLSIPRSGSHGELKYTWGGSLNMSRQINYYGPIYAGETYYKATKDLSLFAGISGGVVDGDDIHSTKYLKIGGLKDNLSRNELAFSGYYYQNLIVDQALIGKVGFNYNFMKNLYLVGNYNIGTFSGVTEDNYSYQYKMWKNQISGVGLGVTYSSFLGPVSVSISKNDSKNSEVLTQFNIGVFLD